MFGKLLIANRGEIAVRIIRTARRLGVATVAVYSDADINAMHTILADEAFRIGPPPAAQSYLVQDAIIAVAQKCKADAIHPGYGFLAESPDFAERVTKANLAFVGPPASAIRAMGLKAKAKQLMQAAGVPVLPGYHGASQDLPRLQEEARCIGFPLLIKPVAGGGGKGMRVVQNEEHFAEKLAAARREASSSFGDDRMLLETFLPAARHIEIQIMADRQGNMIHLFERDCSLQRRHQKLVEEAPAPDMPSDMRQAMCNAAIVAAQQVGYIGAGTVEFIADVSGGLRADRFYFMEMNTRLQVEHPVTEMITGLDLVELQLRIACGEVLPVRQSEVEKSGHAIEVRLCAEDPTRNFLPQTGCIELLELHCDKSLRADLGVEAGDAITPFYDSMIGKLIAHGETREDALKKLAAALAGTCIAGCITNLAFLRRLIQLAEFLNGHPSTSTITNNLSSLLVPSKPPLEAAAAAVVCASGYLAPPRSSSPFDTLKGFRLWISEPQSITLQQGGEQQTYNIVNEGGRFTVGLGKATIQFTILKIDPPNLCIGTGERIIKLAFLRADNGIAVRFEGEWHEFRSIGDTETATDTEGSGVVTSPVPGLVASVAVSEGDTVQRGTTVAIIEAMKMEFQLKAERGGVIRNVHVAAGSQIAEGVIIVEIGDFDA